MNQHPVTMTNLLNLTHTTNFLRKIRDLQNPSYLEGNPIPVFEIAGRKETTLKYVHLARTNLRKEMADTAL